MIAAGQLGAIIRASMRLGLMFRRPRKRDGLTRLHSSSILLLEMI